MKKCNKCGDTKPITAFRKAGKGYRTATCKWCLSSINGGVPTCQYCTFEKKCKDNIHSIEFVPLCFVSSPKHGLYKKKYLEVTA